MPTLWTEVLGFSVKVIFLTFRTTKVMDQIRSFINGGSSESHFLISCLPSKPNIYQHHHSHKIKEDSDKMSPSHSLINHYGFKFKQRKESLATLRKTRRKLLKSINSWMYFFLTEVFNEIYFKSFNLNVWFK